MCLLDILFASWGFVGRDGAPCAPSPCSQAGLWSSTELCHCRCESLCFPMLLVPFSPWADVLDILPRVSISLYLKRGGQPVNPS